jgi:hypothetical protein
MLRKIKSDQSLYCENTEVKIPRLKHRNYSNPCLARYNRISVNDDNTTKTNIKNKCAVSKSSSTSIIESKAKFIIFLTLSVSNQSFFGNIVSFLDTSFEIKKYMANNTDHVSAIKDLSTRIAVDLILYNMIGGGDAFHYAMYLFCIEHAKKILDVIEIGFLNGIEGKK